MKRRFSEIKFRILHLQMSLLWLLLLFFSCSYSYTESLDVYHLPANGQLMTSFTWNFDSREDSAYFPRQLFQLSKAFSFEKLEMFQTIGRWWSDEWGLCPGSGKAAPYGSFIQATSLKDHSRWRLLLETICDLLGLAFNNGWSMETSVGQIEDRNSIQALMPREPLCTENLSRWLLMLPCGSEYGIASILNPRKVFANRYHSLQLTLEKRGESVSLLANLSLVFAWNLWHNNDWTLARIFSKSFGPICPLSDETLIKVNTENQAIYDHRISPSPLFFFSGW